MAQNPFQTEKFKKLQERWAKKLERSGFDELEDDQGRLKTWTGSTFSVKTITEIGFAGFPDVRVESVRKYYQCAGNFLHSHRWPNQKDRMIWALHSDGQSIPKIIDLLTKKGIPITCITVRRRLAHYRQLAGLTPTERKKPQK